MSPVITLKIESHIPRIEFNPDNEMVKKITLNDENISSLILKYGKKLGLLNESLSEPEQLADLLSQASEAIGDIELDMAGFSNRDVEFNLEDSLEKSFNEVVNIEHDYANLDMNNEVQKELRHNLDLEIFAALLDRIYDILIAKVILAAYELEITKVVLDSDFNYPRLTEKLGREMQKVDFEFEIKE